MLAFANSGWRATVGAVRAAAFLTALFLLAMALHPIRAEEPKIYLIELFSTNQVLLHFNTNAHRTYTVQYLDLVSSDTKKASLSNNNSNPARWSNLAVLPAIPFANHYIIVDTRTTPARIYRLLVEP